MEPTRLADRLEATAAGSLVGRQPERERLTALVDGDGAAAVFVHGPGGIGKSTLVAGTLAGAPTVDGRGVEPTPAGVLAALAAELGCDDTLAAVSTALAGRRAVVVDAFERLGIVDGWLRNELLPALPATVTTVFVGRNPPNTAWRSAPGWRPLIDELVVGPLTEADAAELLARRSLPAPLAETVLGFARGHPLALELAAEAFARHPDLRMHDGPPPEVVEELVDVLFDDLAPTERRVVEAASVLRRITEPLLVAVIDAAGLSGQVPVGATWRTVRDLPVTRLTPGGLELTPVVHEVAATGLELRDPGLVRALRRRAAAVALAELDAGLGWAGTADLLHLVQNPVIRNAFHPPPGLQHPVEVAHPDDRPSVLAIVEHHCGPSEAASLARWWDAHARGFVVSRGAGGEVTAFSLVVEASEVDPTLAGSDPVMAIVAADLAARPLPAGGRSLVARQSLSARGGARPSPELASMIVDMKRTYLEMRPHLARVYAARQVGSALRPAMDAMGFGPPLPGPSGTELEACALDFGPGSVDGWLARHVDAEAASEPPDRRSEEASPLARLSAREREVLAALADGLTNRQLAERLFISERTANRHLSNIFTKLEVRNRTAAARIAIQGGLAG